MVKEILKPFDLEKAKAGAKIKTRDGRNVRIVSDDVKCKDEDTMSVLGLVDLGDSETPTFCDKSGRNSYNKQCDLFIVEEVEVSERWRDREDDILKGYYINTNSEITSNPSGFTHDYRNRNIFATTKQAQSALAMAQISQIMANDERFGGVVTVEEYKDSLTMPTIVRGVDNVDKEPIIYSTHIDTTGNWQPLLFHTIKQADLFLEENMDLLKQYFML